MNRSRTISRAVEAESLALAQSEHTYKVRLVYFLSLRCAGCTQARSCQIHEDMMGQVKLYSKEDLELCYKLSM